VSYGSVLTAFAGDFVRVPYYQALSGYDAGPGAPGGYSTVTGILQCVERRTKNSQGTLVTIREMKFWTRKILTTGWFIRDLKQNMVYRIGKDNDWQHEGGFTVYGLIKVEGDDGNVTLDPTSPGSVGTGDFA
jgi:hypothetical protein